MNIEKIVLLETALDHLTGEELGQALEALNEMPEVLDALFLTGIGKKNRPSGLLQVMCLPANEIAARDAVFQHTHALGLRRQEMERYVLPRSATTVHIGCAEVPAKAHVLENETYIRPEADALKKLAAKLGTGTPAIRFRSEQDAP